MIDKTLFADLRSELEQFEADRETVIKTSRDVLRASKAVIYAVHRQEQKIAKARLQEAANSLAAIARLTKANPRLVHVGSIHEAMEEYAEAACLYGVMVEKALPAPDALKVDIEPYLGGVCDTVGELVRRAINLAIDDDVSGAMAIRKAVREIVDELNNVEWRNTPVRRKFDGLKYGVEKLEDLALQLKLKGKI